jgi:hypothetical protein
MSKISPVGVWGSVTEWVLTSFSCMVQSDPTC